jgi:hypothetical protein
VVLFDIEEFDLEDEGGIGRDILAGATAAVGEFRGATLPTTFIFQTPSVQLTGWVYSGRLPPFYSPYPRTTPPVVSLHRIGNPTEQSKVFPTMLFSEKAVRLDELKNSYQIGRNLSKFVTGLI